ncbi:MAG: VCBS repeat-containing protein [Kiritimatiellae bacterium]|nr:VCBS repeat-containing protein [Kiritimatiellia bacterium]
MIAMRQSLAVLAALFLCAAAATGTRTGGVYAVTADTLDGGGQRAAGAAYVNDASMGAIGDLAGSGTVLKGGYPGQLMDLAGVNVSVTPIPMDEGTTGQVAAVARWDDDTVSPLGSNDVQWASPAYPFASVTPDGRLVAAIVYADIRTAVTGLYFGLAGSATQTVMDADSDNFGIYAGDDIKDSWQVENFGADNPDGLADADPDGDRRDNRNEYVTGTQPDDEGSFFKLWNERIEQVTTQGDVFYHPRLDSRTYDVLRSTALLAPDWSDSFAYSESLAGATCTVRDLDLAADATYYRVRVEIIPTNCGEFALAYLPTLWDQRGYALALADFNEDGTLDMFVGYNGPAQILLVATNEGFYPVVTDSGQRLGTGTVYGAAAADLNGDARVDVLTAGPDGARIWYNSGSAVFTGGLYAATNTYCTAVAVGDLNGDTNDDLFICRGSAAFGFKNLVLTNNRSGVFAPVDQSAFILDRSYGVALGDLDNDGDLDAYVANSVANRCYRNDGRARFTLWGTDSRVDDSRGTAIADLNGDGWRDVVVANAWPGPGIVYLNRTNGVLEAYPLGADSSDGTGVAVADLDGDLRLDIAMSGWEDNTVWFGLDGTNFARSSQSLGSERGQAVAVGNINRESALDLVFVHYDSTNTLWLNQCEP